MTQRAALLEEYDQSELATAQEVERVVLALRTRLEPLRAKWCELYVGPARFNSAEASRRVGVHENTGHKWRDREDCNRYCRALIRREAIRINISRNAIIAELGFIGLSDPTELFETVHVALQAAAESEGDAGLSQDLEGHQGDQRANSEGSDTQAITRLRNIHDLPRHTAKSISKIKLEDGVPVEIHFHDKVKALHLLGQAFDLFDGRSPAEAAEAEVWTGFEILPPPERDG